MDPMEAENLLKKIDRRLQAVEQILPTQPSRAEMEQAIAPLATKQELESAVALLATKEELEAAVALLATKEELRAAVAPLATKEELQAAIAPLATRSEMREEGERTRRHFDVVAESLRDDIRLVVESQTALQAEVRRDRKELEATLKNHEKRIVRLEASDARRRKARK